MGVILRVVGRVSLRSLEVEVFVPFLFSFPRCPHPFLIFSFFLLIHTHRGCPAMASLTYEKGIPKRKEGKEPVSFVFSIFFLSHRFD